MSNRVTRRRFAGRGAMGAAVVGLAGVPAGALGGCTPGSQLAPAAKQAVSPERKAASRTTSRACR